MKTKHLLAKVILIFIFTFSIFNFAKSQITVEMIADKDNTINDSTRNFNDGLSPDLRAGRTGGRGANTTLRTLLHFDLSGIPAGSVINAATLTVYVGRVGPVPSGLSFHKLISNWEEVASTWNHSLSPDTAWITPGGDFEAVATISTGNIGLGLLVISNLTADVQSWVNDLSKNFGWMIKGSDESKTNSAKLIGSREQGADIFRPRLTVTYTPVVNKAPAVYITSPANDSTYTAPANIIFTAAASDSDGTVSTVAFYKDSTLLYTATDTPYTFKWQNVPSGNYVLTARATDNKGLATISDQVRIYVVPNKAPTISLLSPVNGQTFLRGQTIYLEAAADDSDGRVTKVEFYSDTTLLAIERKPPYNFSWLKVPVGNYTITAKATDNRGAATSVAVNVLVVANTAPSVSIISPVHGEHFTAPATINLEATALDADGRIVKVDFYNGATLLATERKPPYNYQWMNVPAGAYTIIARAMDNWGAVTNSAPVTITVTDTVPMSGRPSLLNSKLNTDGAVRLELGPNPANNMVSIYVKGLSHNKQITLSLISASGVIIKTIKISGSAQIIPLNVSSFLSGVYTIKIISGDKVIYKKFVKL